jgi:SpoVK/Ycf46/Vps4 family AAA+-type ATPase
MRKKLIALVALAFVLRATPAFAKDVAVRKVVGTVTYHTLDDTWAPLTVGTRNELETIQLAEGSRVFVQIDDRVYVISEAGTRTIKDFIKSAEKTELIDPKGAEPPKRTRPG